MSAVIVHESPFGGLILLSVSKSTVRESAASGSRSFICLSGEAG
jgi:hypothetical protein